MCWATTMTCVIASVYNSLHRWMASAHGHSPINGYKDEMISTLTQWPSNSFCGWMMLTMAPADVINNGICCNSAHTWVAHTNDCRSACTIASSQRSLMQTDVFSRHIFPYCDKSFKVFRLLTVLLLSEFVWYSCTPTLLLWRQWRH